MLGGISVRVLVAIIAYFAGVFGIALRGAGSLYSFRRKLVRCLGNRFGYIEISADTSVKSVSFTKAGWLYRVGNIGMLKLGRYVCNKAIGAIVA